MNFQSENSNQSWSKAAANQLSNNKGLEDRKEDSQKPSHLDQLQLMADKSLEVNKTFQLQSLADQRSIKTEKNLTGLPDQLKTGLENLSGYSMNDVKVHYNSNKPAQLQAHAYAQGNQIHLAPGQERHLPHEAWHVVQQKQGRVKPTIQMKGNININDDPILEQEADIMGNKANISGLDNHNHKSPNASFHSSASSIQRQPISVIQLSSYTDTDKDNHEIYMIYEQKSQDELVQYIGRTNQGIETRFGQHKASKQWVTDLNCKIEKLAGGSWTKFEVATHEQFWILDAGGKAILENSINGITYKKYTDHREPKNSAWNANQELELWNKNW